MVHLVPRDAAFMHFVGDRDPHGRPSSAFLLIVHHLAAPKLALQSADIQSRLEAGEQLSAFNDDDALTLFAAHVQPKIFLNEIGNEHHLFLFGSMLLGIGS